MGRFILSLIGWVILVYVIIVVSILVLGELLNNWAIYLSIGLSVVVAFVASACICAYIETKKFGDVLTGDFPGLNVTGIKTMKEFRDAKLKYEWIGAGIFFGIAVVLITLSVLIFI